MKIRTFVSVEYLYLSPDLTFNALSTPHSPSTHLVTKQNAFKIIVSRVISSCEGTVDCDGPVAKF